MEVEANGAGGATGITPEMLAQMTATSKELSKGRKKRQPPADQVTAEALAAFGTLASKSVFKTAASCVEVHPSEELLASGGADGSIVLLDCKAEVKATLKGHTAAVSRVRLHPSKPLVVSCSLDGSARSWSLDGSQLHAFTGHTAEVTDCSLHATGDYFVTASADKSWSLSDLNRGSCVLSVKDAAAGYTCAGFHPDGLILGTGTEKVVRIWDVKSQNNVASFEGHEGTLSSLAFSENGYYLATGAADATVKLWDLRKLKNFHTISSVQGPVTSVSFDYSGQYLIVGSSAVNVFESKSWGEVVAFSDVAAGATGVGFGKGASFAAASTSDGVVKVYGSK